MGRSGFDLAQMKEFQEKLNKLDESAAEQFCEECAKELAGRLLRKVIKRTPVGQYPKGSGKKGGTLRRGWTGGQKYSKGYIDTLAIEHEAGRFIIEIVNPVEYAGYVEYGHRTANHRGWVPGQFIMTISEQELGAIAPKVLEARLKKFLGGVFS